MLVWSVRGGGVEMARQKMITEAPHTGWSESKLTRMIERLKRENTEQSLNEARMLEREIRRRRKFKPPE